MGSINLKRPLLIAAIIVVSTLVAKGDSQLTGSAVETKLMQLRPLPKVHYYYPVPEKMLNEKHNRELYELIRITHSLSVEGYWTNENQINNSVYNCARVNMTNPKIPASLAIKYSPWYREFGKELPPYANDATAVADINEFEVRMKKIKTWVAQANHKYNSDVQVSALIFDCERFHVKPDDEKWNNAIKEKLNLYHAAGKSTFPNARIEWYGWGIWLGKDKKTVTKTPYWTGKETIESLSCSLYTVADLEYTTLTYIKTCELANSMKINSVTPTVALASGLKTKPLKGQYFELDWDYSVENSYQLGAFLNLPSPDDQNNILYKMSDVIVFWPPPFDTTVPHWTKHFIAYVRGATGVKELKDLEYEEQSDKIERNL